MKPLVLTLSLFFCLTVNAQIDLANINKLEINNSNQAKIDVDAPASSQVLKIRSNESGSGDYSIVRTSYSGNNGETRKDHVLCFGYNCGGAGFVSTEPELHLSFENRYKTEQGRLQSEFYLTMSAMVNGQRVSTRAIAGDLYHDDGSVQLTFNSPSIYISNPAQTNQWLRFVTTDTSGDLNMTGDSGINYSGSREFAISRYGVGMIGSSSPTQWSLFNGGITGETLNVFKYSSIGSGSAPLMIKLGSDGGSLRIGGSSTSPWRWQITGNYSGYSDIQTAYDVDSASAAYKIVKRGSSAEINVSRVEVGGVKVLGARCGAIANSDGTEEDNTRAVNAMLACLRTHGMIAP